MNRSYSLRVGFWQPLRGEHPEYLCDQLHEMLSATSVDVLILPERFSMGGRIDPHGHICVQSKPDRPQFSVTSISFYDDDVMPTMADLARGLWYSQRSR